MTTPAITADLSQPGTQAPAPGPTGPHARLLQMIQGLSVGVGALAHSATTGGREGGPEEVQAYQAEQQKEQLRAQESQQSTQRAQREQQESDLRMKTMNANLLMQQAAYHHALQMYPSEEKGAALDVLNKATASYKDALAEGYDIADPSQAALWRSMQQSIINIPFSSGQSQQEVLSSATDAAEKAGKHITDYVPLADYTDGKHGTGGNLTLVPAASLQQVQATPRQIAMGMAQMKATLDTAKTALGPDDADVKGLGGKIDMIQKVLDSGGKPSAYDFIQLNSSVIGPLSTRIGGATQSAKLQKEKTDADKAKQDLANVAPDAQVALARRKAQAEQSVKDGDPNAAADLLGKGLVAPSELISARNPAFAQKALSAAATKYPEFNAQKAEADFHIAKSEDNTKFFGAANSLLGKGGVGGNLDLLADKYKTLKNGNIPLFNKMADYTKAAAGDPALSGFVQAVIGVADDYAKVMGGGVGTDAARLQLLQAFSNAKNPAQMRNSIRTAKQALSSQAEARIGNNPVLKQMYGGATMPPAPKDATGIAPGSDGKDHYHDAKGQDLGIAP